MRWIATSPVKRTQIVMVESGIGVYLPYFSYGAFTLADELISSSSYKTPFKFGCTEC